RRNEIGRKRVGFERERQRFLGITVLEVLSLPGEEHATAAIGDGLVDQAVTALDRERLQCVRPIAELALNLEQRVRRPAELRVELKRALGELAGGFRLAFALRF